MECRLATSEDKSEIIQAFPGIYGGLDYLPHNYDYFMKSPRYICYVGEMDGQIVAFLSTNILDDNKAYLVRSERVRVGYQGKGLIKQLTAFADEYVKKYLIGPIVKRKFAYRSSEEILKKLQRHPERKPMETRVQIGTALTMEKLKTCLQREDLCDDKAFDIIDTKKITGPDESAIKRILSGYCKAMDNSLCIMFRAYGNYEINWDDILENINWAVIDQEMLKNQGEIQALPVLFLVRFWPCEFGLRCDIEVLSQGHTDLPVDKFCAVLKKFCVEFRHFSGNVASWIQMGMQHSEKVKAAVSAILGDQQWDGKEIYYVYEELHI